MDKLQLFHISLRALGMTMRAFAEEHGVVVQTVYDVINGKIVSARISTAIDDVIWRGLARIKGEIETRGL